MDLQKPRVGVVSGAPAPLSMGATRSSVAAISVSAGASGYNSAPERTPSPAPQPQPKPKKCQPAWLVWLLVVAALLITAGGVYAFGQQRLSTITTELTESNDSLRARASRIEEEATAAVAEAKKTADEAAAKAAAPVASAEFVEIKELGFKFKPGAELKDLVYFVSGSSVYFSTKSLMASEFKVVNAKPASVKRDYVCTPSEGAIAVVQKDTKTSAGAIKVGNFFLTSLGPQGSCSDDKTTIDLQLKQKNAFTAAIKTAEEVK